MIVKYFAGLCILVIATRASVGRAVFIIMRLESALSKQINVVYCVGRVEIQIEI